MAWVTVAVELPFSFSAGGAGAVGKALGTPAVGGVVFNLKVEVETDQECKIRKFTPIPSANAGAAMRLTGAPTIITNKTSADKKGCQDTNLRKDHWDEVEVTAIWVAESAALSLPGYFPGIGSFTIPLTPSTQNTIQLTLTIWPNGSGRPSKRQRAWVDGILQFDHT